MKRIVLLMIIFLFIFISCDSSTENKISSELKEKYLMADSHAKNVSSEISEANSRFALKLLEKLSIAEPDKNIVISPISLSIALAMAANGASDENLSEMLDVMEFSNMEMTIVNSQINELTQSLVSADRDVTLDIANSIWIRDTFSPKEPFRNNLADYYNTEPFSENFDAPETINKINAWISEKTNGKINDIVETIGVNISMFLINAAYFNAKWTTAFDKGETYKSTFYTDSGEKSVDFITFKEGQDLEINTVLSNTEESYTILKLPYGRAAFSFYAITPIETETNLDDFIVNMKEKGLNSYFKGLYEEEIKVSLPKFKFKYKKDFPEILKELGMTKAFEPGGFLNLSDDKAIFLSEIVNSTFIEVNESGTEAATSTSSSTNAKGGALEVKFDHPFVFIIHDDRNGSILFIGKVEDPTAE